MRFPLFAVALLLAAAPALVAAQVRPTTAQAEALLRTRPDLVAELQSRLKDSDLTPEQIRMRLRAAGYPESLLDAYLARSATGTAAPAPTGEMLTAMQTIGLVEELDLTELLEGAATRDTATAPATPEVEIFGLSLFRRSTSLFLPNLDGPVDANYRLGPGDGLTVLLSGDVQQTYAVEVTREGQIVIPQIGAVGVANLTLGELESVLYSRLSRVYSGLSRAADARTRMNVTVTRLRSLQVFVAGDVLQPGSYRVTSAGTALTALYAAGGPTDEGSLRRVEVRRGGKAVGTLDLYAYLLRGDASGDVRLQHGDVVFVPVRGAHAKVTGAVMRPAIYELRDGESLDALVQAAGGFAANAERRRVMIERIVPGPSRTADGGRDRAVLDVAVPPSGVVPALRVEDGDVLRVMKVSDRVRGRIVVNGHVWGPGAQGFEAGLTLSEALRRAGGVQPDAYLDAVHVSRLRPDSTREQLRAALLDATGRTAAPFALQEDDEILVFSRTAFRPEQYVAVDGAVKTAGRYAWREGMTLRDVVLLAGGLTAAASVTEVEIARTPQPRTVGVLASTIRVPIDSSYLFHLGAAARAADVTLQPFDQVLILRDPTWRVPPRVILTGEVAAAGTYTLRGVDERLSDLLARAGGLTAQANPDGVYFARRRLLSDSSKNDLLRRPYAELRDTTSRALADSAYTMYRVAVDVPAVLRRPSRSDNLQLRDGDSLHIPARRQIVTVRGAVNAPTAIAYDGEHTIGYYLRAAGGVQDGARSRRAYVIQPNGKIEARRRLLYVIPLDPTPRAGAEVVVPTPLPGAERQSVLTTVTALTQILATLATVIVLTR